MKKHDAQDEYTQSVKGKQTGDPVGAQTPIVEISGLCHSFHHARGTRAPAIFDNFDLSLEKGTVTSILGPSGCGKTTLLNIVAGLIKHESGSVRVDGSEVAGPSPRRGVVFQRYSLFPWLTIRQNVEFGPRMAGLSRQLRREKSDRYLELVGLTKSADLFPKELSGGMMQRAAVARAYAAEPDVLLMDEPFGALDAETRAGLQEELLDTWLREKKTIMFITHDVDEAAYLSQRVVVLRYAPAQIVLDMEVDLTYPRNPETRLDPKFLEVRERVWKVLHSNSSADTTLQVNAKES